MTTEYVDLDLFIDTGFKDPFHDQGWPDSPQLVVMLAELGLKPESKISAAALAGSVTYLAHRMTHSSISSQHALPNPGRNELLGRYAGALHYLAAVLNQGLAIDADCVQCADRELIQPKSDLETP